MPCTLSHERALWRQGIDPIAGIDEAGRGPLAGPVVVAAAVLTKSFRLPELDDSKKLTPALREKIYPRLVEMTTWSVSILHQDEIDRLNILRATHEGMRRAATTLSVAVVHVLIDGLPVPNFPLPQTALVKGDSLSKSIAAASVIAKVTRDRIMEEMHELYPHYGFRQHKGYATPEHLLKLREHGPCPIHRQSFEPVAQQYLF